VSSLRPTLSLPPRSGHYVNALEGEDSVVKSVMEGVAVLEAQVAVLAEVP
jgi:hypothetical protein